MLECEEFRARFVPGDRVWRLSSDQVGRVASEELAGKILVCLGDGSTELWHVEDTEPI